MSQTENRPLWWSETGKIHLNSPWMLCSIQHQSSQKYSHSIPACIALRPVLRKSAQPPQWWFFATSCHLAAGLISMKDLEIDWISQQYVDPWNSSPTEGFFGSKWKGISDLGVDIYNFDWLNNHQQWMLPSWASINYADDPSPRFLLLLPSLLNFLLINRNRKVRDVIFASQKSEIVIFFTHQSQLRSCFVRIPLY